MREEQDSYNDCGVDNCQMSVLEAALTDGQPIVLIGHDDYILALCLYLCCGFFFPALYCKPI